MQGLYLVSPAAASESAAMQLVLTELTSAQVVLLATPELTQAALEKLEETEEYTHLLLGNNNRLQVFCRSPNVVTKCHVGTPYRHMLALLSLPPW